MRDAAAHDGRHTAQGHRGRGHGEHDPHEDPTRFWERLYGESAVWSGRVNASLAAVAEAWEPGRSLDLGCGEGGDVLWLAERGWRASGVDLSETAVARARAAAAERGLTARFIAADLGEWIAHPEQHDAAGSFDLVTASFLQSPVELPRERILRAAAGLVAPRGRLVVISHAAPPAWASDHPGPFPSPQSERELLALDPERWELAAELRSREATAPDGTPASLTDTVLVARRRG
ncbi:class I SAM-dependent methyltransferase [Leucobacter massiliensis]|uniref:Methyltransferase domain-containing protein n=1 Tax=Leucobacter massiliensis TaxID=1686285 RepID=A0A2S9QN05_9MICO|nr:class I SAM-dependent methyltransferase [Leucobacter massiliensis]PRI10969.1 hypothetical protein B4915_08780 [Leucobacter massiliensis]